MDGKKPPTAKLASESAWRRAKRDAKAFAGQGWYRLLDYSLGGAAALWFIQSPPRWLVGWLPAEWQAGTIETALGLVGGVLVMLALSLGVLLAFFVKAPVFQRDEARQERDALSSQSASTDADLLSALEGRVIPMVGREVVSGKGRIVKIRDVCVSDYLVVAGDHLKTWQSEQWLVYMFTDGLKLERADYPFLEAECVKAIGGALRSLGLCESQTRTRQPFDRVEYVEYYRLTKRGCDSYDAILRQPAPDWSGSLPS